MNPNRPRPIEPTATRRTRPVSWAGALIVALALTTAACGSSGSSGDRGSAPAGADTTVSAAASSTDPEAPGTFAVGQASRTWVDRTRPTDAHGGEPEQPERTLEVLILYPADGERTAEPVTDAEPLRGPWPVILFGHGSTTLPEDYLDKLDHWASAGYVIVAPAFPLSKEGTPGGTSYLDYPNQTGDESFVIDQLGSDDEAPLHLRSLIDPDRIGLAGQSFGAITALGTVAAECCADDRIRAATTFAGMWLDYPSGDELADHAGKVPVLFIHGDEDPTLPYDADVAFFERLGAPGGFLTLVGSGHDPGFFGSDQTELDALVSAATLAFYDQYLRDGPDATPIIEALVAEVGPKVATFTPSG